MGQLLHALHTRGNLPAGFVAAHPSLRYGAPPQFFKARNGQQPSFLSQRDADAYDSGWDGQFGAAPDEPADTPRSRGYADHARQRRMAEASELADSTNQHNARVSDAVDGVVNQLAAAAAVIGGGYVLFAYFLLPLFQAAQ